jgi:hypothetical protein
MKSRNVILTLVLILLLSGIFLCQKWQEPKRKEALDRRPDHITFSFQALCLMKCQQIREEEIERVIKKGVILLNKSSRFSRPCPTFAVQGSVSEGKSVRVMLMQCTQETKVLSCYIVNQTSKCECPGNRDNVN